jgi:hypothetical protein
MNLAMRHPEVYSSVYMLNAPLFLPSKNIVLDRWNSEEARQGASNLEAELSALPREQAHAKFLENFDQLRGPSGGDLHQVISYGTAFAPNPEKNAPYFDYFEPDADSEPEVEILDMWKNGLGGLSGEVGSFKENLLDLNAIVLDYPKSSQTPGLSSGNGTLCAALYKAGIKHDEKVHVGDDDTDIPERIGSQILPFFSEQLAFE